VNTPQSAEPASACSQATPIGQLDAASIAHHHVLHIAPPIDQHAHLSADVGADLGEIAGELVADEAVRGQASPEQALDLSDLAGLQAARIAENLDVGTPRSARMGTAAW
jgi:hypothetical protein